MDTSERNSSTNVIPFPAAQDQPDGYWQDCALCRRLFLKSWVASTIRDPRGYLCPLCLMKMLRVVRDMTRKAL